MKYLLLTTLLLLSLQTYSQTVFAPWREGVAASAGPTVFNVGTYTGNGTDSREITVGFQPDLVIVKSITAVSAIFRTSNMGADSSMPLTGTGAPAGNKIQSFTATGFVVGTDTTVNGLTTYHWQAWKQVAGYMKVGTYVGNGAEPQVVTGVGFQPALVLEKGRHAHAAWKKYVSMTTTKSCNFSATTTSAQNIVAIGADGFSVSYVNWENEPGILYYYAAFKEQTGYMEEGAYIGNNTDNRDLSVTTFQPDLVWVSGNNVGARVFKVSTQTGADMFTFEAAIDVSGTTIKQFNANGFRLGIDTRTNGDTIDYWFFCWKIQ